MAKKLYIEIYKQLEKKLHNGVYQPGNQLPSEVELQKIFDVSRTTIRKAVDLLIKKQLVVRKNGIGLFAAPRVTEQNLLEMTGIMKSTDLVTQKQVFKEAFLRKAGSYYAFLFNIKKNELIYYLNFVQYHADSLTQEIVILPLKLFPTFNLATLKVLHILEIANSGLVPIKRLRQNLQLVTLCGEQAKLLEVVANEPVFKFENQFLDKRNNLIALEYRYEAANANCYVVDFN